MKDPKVIEKFNSSIQLYTKCLQDISDLLAKYLQADSLEQLKEQHPHDFFSVVNQGEIKEGYNLLDDFEKLLAHRLVSKEPTFDLTDLEKE
jgi:hypothetical protein